MHPSAERLFAAAARHLRKPEVKASDIASLLGVTAQVVTNWSTRGVSKEGAILAEQHLKTSAMQIMRGSDYFLPFGASAIEPGCYELKETTTAYDWPFRTVRKADLRKITLEDLEQLEGIINRFLATKLAKAESVT